MKMKLQINDGGRKAAGYRGKTSDCVTRAVAIATGLPYQQVFDVLSKGTQEQRNTCRGKARKDASKGVNTTRKWFQDYMKSLGWEWVACMGIGTGCKVHLAAGELPMGKIIARVSRHYVAVIDGIMHDTHDCSRNGTRCVYGYWKRA